MKNIEEARALSSLSKKIAKEVYGLNGNERICYTNGGLGNQLCQYFFYRFLECSGKAPVIADTTLFFHSKQHNGYEVEKIFGFKVRKLCDVIPGTIYMDMVKRAEQGECIAEQLYQAGYNISVVGEVNEPKFSGSITYMPSYYPIVSKNIGMIYYHTYTIIGDYFNELRKANCIPANPFPPLVGEANEKYASEMKSTESVAIHIRRGDFVNLNWALPPEMYASAVKAMNEKISNPTYFIFSDDLAYCNEHIDELGLTHNNVIFVEGNKNPNNYLDMQLMAMCKHRIVNNSSFCFCAALFREDRDGLMVNLNPLREIF